MILRNFARILAGNGGMYSLTGVIPQDHIWQFYSLNDNTKQGSYTGIGNSYIRVGTGNTAPIKTDYALETDVTASLTYVSGILVSGTNDDYKSLTQVLKNETSDSIIIKEIAWGLNPGNYSYQESSAVILTRKVLDTPIAIASGQSFSFNITLSF